jgi:UDPglucose 6-dehydrogenase
VCEATGADVTQLADAIGHDDRIGRKFLGAGVGFGGGCLPKDIRAFAARADELGVTSVPALLGEADKINLGRRTRVVELTRELAGGDLEGVRVAALGATFKPNSDDVRDAPALAVARALYAAGAKVTVFDPEGMKSASRVAAELDYADTAADALCGADVVVLLTEWAEFRNLDPAETGDLVNRRAIVDGRNALDPKAWRAAGWTFAAPGRP